MTVFEGAILAIAIVNVALMVAIIVMLLRLKRIVDVAERVVEEQAVPLMQKLSGVADEVSKIAKDVRGVEQRISGTASKVLDQVEPPVRQFAALLAAVRAGIGRFVHASQDGRSTLSVVHEPRRE